MKTMESVETMVPNIGKQIKPQKENSHTGDKAFNLKSVLIKAGIFLGVAGITAGGILFFRQRNNNPGEIIYQDPVTTVTPVLEESNEGLETLAITSSPTAELTPTPEMVTASTETPYVELTREEKLELIFGGKENLAKIREDTNMYTSKQIMSFVLDVNDVPKIVYMYVTSRDTENMIIVYYFDNEYELYTIPQKNIVGKSYDDIRIDKYEVLSEVLSAKNATVLASVGLSQLQAKLDELGIPYITTTESEKISSGKTQAKTLEGWANYYLDTTYDNQQMFVNSFQNELGKIPIK